LLRFFIEGLGLGLSLGITCAVTCGPVFLPYILRKEQSLKQSFIAMGKIFAGRFIANGVFGAIAGYIGGVIPDSIRIPISLGSFVILGGLLIYFGLKGESNPGKCARSSTSKFLMNPFLIGLITGLQICPPFLLAIAAATSTGGALNGFIMFLGFFFGTSLFLIPITFFGAISSVKILRKIAAVIAVAIGAWFFIQGINGLITHFSIGTPAEKADYSIVGVPDAKEVIIVSENSWGDTLKTLLSGHTQAKIIITNPDSALALVNKIDTLSMVIWFVESDNYQELTKNIGVIVLRNSYNKKSLLQFKEFITNYYFKRKHGSGFAFRWEAR